MSSRPLLDELMARLPDARRSGGADGRGVLPEGVRARLARDPAAALLWQRLVAQVRTLDRLPRLEAPADLEGRVVAALNEGYLQDRAVGHMASLERAEAPPSLDARVRHLAERPFALPGVVAPSVLDRLVELELEDSPGLVARLMDKLVADDRARSPLHRILARGVLQRAGQAGQPLRRVAWAAALVAVGAFGWTWFGPRAASAPRYATELVAAGVSPGQGAIRWEVVQPDQAAPPELASLLNAVTGGAVPGRSK